MGYIIKPKSLIAELERGGPFKARTLFTVMIKYVAPILTLLMLVSSMLDVFGVVKI